MDVSAAPIHNINKVVIAPVISSISILVFNIFKAKPICINSKDNKTNKILDL
jgi:hypothetical protein